MFIRQSYIGEKRTTKSMTGIGSQEREIGEESKHSMQGYKVMSGKAIGGQTPTNPMQMLFLISLIIV